MIGPAANEEAFDGVALHEQLPWVWEPATLDDAARVEQINMETARALQALSVFEEAPREPGPDSTAASHELAHLEAKIDVLLSLVGRLVGARFGMPAPRPLVLRAGSAEWPVADPHPAQPGDTGYFMLYPNSLLPLSLQLASRIVGQTERSGRTWLLARFEALSPAVCSGMEKLVFRRHRRQIAIAKGTGVFMETGTFPAPKL